jgi:hypothetical protein
MSNIAVAIIYLVVVVIVTWVLICARRTNKAQSALIAWLATLEKARMREGLEYNEDFLRPFDRVSFYRHFVYLLTFRNPMRLYDR